jgi:hypothetical protein
MYYIMKIEQEDIMKVIIACFCAYVVYQFMFKSEECKSCDNREFFDPVAAGSHDPRFMGAPVDFIGNDKIETTNRCMGDSGQFISSNLLPKDDPKMRDWSEFAPKGPLQGQDMLLEPSKCIGEDTVSNHLRNASYDIRKEPPNPMKPVSPWINTTIGPDLNRLPLEDCNYIVNQK